MTLQMVPKLLTVYSVSNQQLGINFLARYPHRSQDLLNTLRVVAYSAQSIALKDWLDTLESPS